MNHPTTRLFCLAAASALSLAALSACSDKAAEPAAPATETAATSTPAPETAPAAAPAAPAAPAPEVVDSAQVISDKLNAYIKCYNGVNQSAQRSIERYASWVKNMDTGPTGQESIVYGLDTLASSAVSNCKDDITAAVAQTPAIDGLDNAARAYLDALLPLNDKLNEADNYYSRENHKDDAFAKGKAMHQPLRQAMQAFEVASTAMSNALDVENDKRQATELARVEQTEGRKLRYWHMATMADAKHLVHILDKASFNMEDATAKLAAYEKTADELVAYAKAHEDERPMMWSSVDQHLETFRVAAKERLRRVRDKTPYNSGERMIVGTDGEWMVKGSPGKLVHAYNDLIKSSNSLR
ncbi:YiiG family protein [Ottowia sp.]|uniref:YiiG family protein n=1 Tax=Ottowia sp. TaxID=1898956 RepID=UPI003A8B49BE